MPFAVQCNRAQSNLPGRGLPPATPPPAEPALVAHHEPSFRGLYRSPAPRVFAQSPPRRASANSQRTPVFPNTSRVANGFLFCRTPHPQPQTHSAHALRPRVCPGAQPFFSPLNRVLHPHRHQPLFRRQPLRPLVRHQGIPTCNTAPRIIQNTLSLRHIHKTRATRIQVNVIPKRFVVLRATPFDHHSLVTISKQPTPFAMPHIESTRHRVLKPFHTLHQIRLRSLNEKVVMIPHQHPSMHAPTCFFADIGEALQKNHRS
jgi:hypothetical protein